MDVPKIIWHFIEKNKNRRAKRLLQNSDLCPDLQYQNSKPANARVIPLDSQSTLFMAALHNKINSDELKQRLQESKEARVTLSFYQYANIEDPKFFRNQIYQDWSDLGVFGRIYVAKEGINGQISVPAEQFEAFREKMYEVPFLNNIRLNIAIEDDGKSFYKLKIKVREKIVADGLDDSSFDVTKRGKHLSAKEFNELTDPRGCDFGRYAQSL